MVPFPHSVSEWPVRAVYRPTAPVVIRSDIPDDAPRYLYLAEPEYAETWVNGGMAPINPASKYLSEIRAGTLTPDEVTQKTVTGGSMKIFDGIFQFSGGGSVNVTMSNNVINGVLQSGTMRYSQFPEHALILCMCEVYDASIMERLGHKVAVKIPSVAALKACLDGQIGVVSQAGSVEYTDEPGSRTHFLKSIEDSWQREYRLAWIGDDLGTESRTVRIDVGLAVPI